jgi:hypothetical protein
MSKRAVLAVLLASLWLLTSCSTIVAALLVRELLNDEAPKRTWSGVVRDTTGSPVGGLLVQVRAEIEGDPDFLSYSGTTNLDGEYQVGYRWHEDVSYAVRVVHEGVVFAEEHFGRIELKDMETDFVIQGSVVTELSGVVTDWQGDPLEDVALVGASALTLSGTPSVLLDGDGDPLYYATNASGIYQLEGSIGRYGIVCAYHPDHGFAYGYGEDDDSDGSIPLNIAMGEAGTFTVSVQVVDGVGAPISDQVLDPARQFRLRLRQPWNLGTVMDEVVDAHELFPGLVGVPSDTHPETLTITVQSTDADGIADQSAEVAGGVYELSLVNVEDDNPATALVESDDPLVLHADGTVIVRVSDSGGRRCVRCCSRSCCSRWRCRRTRTRPTSATARRTSTAGMRSATALCTWTTTWGNGCSSISGPAGAGPACASCPTCWP